ncbi:MAG: methionyl-tRNA formyltransferase [Gemmatimonadota bacterium]|nr:MAG: methionyl-tRNA formyltransferase [Gemmatimonadota bacterium]
MKIIFMGTAEFGLPSLERLLESSHTVQAVVTGPDRRKGRGLKVVHSPVKAFAEEKHIPILQPERLHNAEFVSTLKEYHPDLFVVVAFRILPREVFEIPVQGTINLHASLLPKYRGAAPIQWALIRGEKRTGVTTFFIDERIDTGNLILQKEMGIDENETAGQLHDKLALLGAEVLMETVELIGLGRAVRKPQDDGQATTAPKLKKEEGRIDWSKKAIDIKNHVRGMNPFPGAFTEWKGRIVKVHRTQLATESMERGVPGEVVRIDSRAGLIVSTGEGALSLAELQPEGKRRMSGLEFVRGYRVKEGDVFGSNRSLT